MPSFNPSIKFLAVLLGALLATCACFYLMLFLISRELSGDLEIVPASQITPKIAEQRDEEPPEPMRTRPNKVMPLDPPPEPEMTFANRTSRVSLNAERPTFGSMADMVGPVDVNLNLDAPLSDLVPVSVVQPIYPLSAVMREVEGYVIVEFSVRENGTVINPVVVRSEPSVMFDQAALNAVSRFRFKPREVAGEKVRVDNVQMKFAFSLDSLYAVDEANQR